VLVDVKCEERDCRVKCYAIIDNQSNTTLASPALLDKLNITGQLFEFSINICNGVQVKTGMCSKHLIFSANHGSYLLFANKKHT
jgi:hypothetical protein